jgi:hypothetical protein
MSLQIFHAFLDGRVDLFWIGSGDGARLCRKYGRLVGLFGLGLKCFDFLESRLVLCIGSRWDRGRIGLLVFLVEKEQPLLIEKRVFIRLSARTIVTAAQHNAQRQAAAQQEQAAHNETNTEHRFVVVHDH